MKKLLFVPVLLMSLFFGNRASACYANYTHTNACAGDTVWFYAADYYAVQYWDFGDTASGADNMAFGDTSYHVFTAPGTYYVTHFVNVGAEWAYETDAITVGTDCFAASFTAPCTGGTYMYFTNTSTGSGLTYSWDFGDASSTMDTSTMMTPPYYYYPAYGNYDVTLIISDGTNSDTVVQTVHVDSLCLSASYSYMMGTCVGDTFNFTGIYYSGGVTSASWDFGDGTTGTGLFPAHYYTSAGLYIATVTFTDGVSTGTLSVPALMNDCDVWPGDGNDDGEVGGEDIFPIAIYNGAHGAARPGASSAFTGQPCAEWVDASLGALMYLQKMVPFINADYNGDGYVNTDDIAVVTANFGMKHYSHNNNSTMQLLKPTDPTLAVQLPAVSITHYDGAFNVADLMLGTAAVPGGYTYGFSVAIPYDASKVNPSSISVDFAGSWLDSAAQTHLIKWYYNDLINHVLYIVSARDNKIGFMGYGAVAHISYNIWPGASGPMTWDILPSAKVLSNSMEPGDNPATSAYGNVQRYTRAHLAGSSTNVLLGVNDIHMADANLLVSPVPAAKTLSISMKNNEKINGVVITNPAGQQVLKTVPVNGSIDVSTLSNGIYLMQVNTAAGNYQQKIEIVR